MNIYVFSENILLTAELITCAKTIDASADVSAVLVGSGEDTAKLAAMGVSKVLWLGEVGSNMVEDFVPTIAKLIDDCKPDVFLVGATTRGKAVAARVAARLGTSAVVNAKNISADKRVSHVIYGGGAVREEKSVKGCMIATVASGANEAAQVGSSSAKIENIPFVKGNTGMTVLSRTAKKSGSTDILGAKKVVCAGRGFFTADDLAYANDLAKELDAAVGYSRPVIELGLPELEGEPYIGVSGIQIKPDLYVAVAVSGQTQHMVGVSEAKTIVAINNTPDEFIFSQSDYGIVGNYKKVIPALVAALKNK